MLDKCRNITLLWQKTDGRHSTFKNSTSQHNSTRGAISDAGVKRLKVRIHRLCLNRPVSAKLKKRDAAESG